MAKKTNPQKQKAVSPEKFMRSRARQLPIDKCYISSGWQENSEATLFITRRHTHGTITFASFLVDTWCLGIIDSFYRVNITQDEFDDILHYFQDNIELEEVTYDLAHNLIYGVLEYAEEAGFEPCREFGVSQYILDEDDDNVPLIELEFGHKGRYCLVADSYDSAQKYLNTLKKNIGEDNFDYIIDGDFYKGTEMYGEQEGYKSKYNRGKSGIYDYENYDYPTEDDLYQLHNPALLETLKTPLPEMDATQIKRLLSAPKQELAEDLDLIIRYLIGVYCNDENFEEIDYYEDHWDEIIPNAVRLLAEVGSIENADTFFEVLRQDDDFIEIHFGDFLHDLIAPFMYKILADNPEVLLKFMKEKRLNWFTRSLAIETYVCMVYNHHPERRTQLLEMVEEILVYYLANKDNPYIWDGLLVGNMLGCLETLQAVESEELVRELYATGYVDEDVYGYVDEALAHIAKGEGQQFNAPFDIYEWCAYMKKKF